MIPIVLTGTVIPNANFVVFGSAAERLNHYIAMLNYYQEVGKVYFLENSSITKKELTKAIQMPEVEVVKFPLSNFTDKGKGYQEFEMLDTFVDKILVEDWFLKITGRYRISNVRELISSNTPVIPRFELKARRKICLTSYFLSSKEFYRMHILGLHKSMDDENGRWSERVLYDKLMTVEGFSFFSIDCLIEGVSGSTGEDFKKNLLKHSVSNIQRILLQKIGARRIYF